MILLPLVAAMHLLPLLQDDGGLSKGALVGFLDVS